MKRRNLLASAAMGLMLAQGAFAQGMDKVKACFVYVGPIGDGGWTFQHHEGAMAVQEKFGDKVEEGTFDVEDLAMGFIRFDNGACLQIEFSWASNIEKEKHFVELRGDKAGLCWENGSLKIFSEKKGKLTDEKPRFKASNGHMRNLRNFVDVVLEGAQPVFVPQQGVDMIKILDAVYRSAESGREIRLD